MKFPLAPMGVLAPVSAQAGLSAQPPTGTSGILNIFPSIFSTLPPPHWALKAYLTQRVKMKISMSHRTLEYPIRPTITLLLFLESQTLNIWRCLSACLSFQLAYKDNIHCDSSTTLCRTGSNLHGRGSWKKSNFFLFNLILIANCLCFDHSLEIQFLVE